MKSGNWFIPALGLLFIGLKLTDYIDWSWWWVLAPFWLGIALWAAIIACVLLIGGLVTGAGKALKWFKG